MEPMMTISLRLPVDLFEWVKAEGDTVALTPTTAARSLLAKARNVGITLK